MNQLISQVNQVATTTVDVTRWSRHLENKLSQSLKDVEICVAYSKTKNKDLSKTWQPVNGASETLNPERFGGP